MGLGFMRDMLGCGNTGLVSGSRQHPGVGLSASPTAASAVQVNRGLWHIICLVPASHIYEDSGSCTVCLTACNEQWQASAESK